MIEIYIYKTLISFVSLKVLIIFFKDNWLKLNPKRNGFIKRNINTLLPCLVPVFRWIWVSLFIILSFCLFSDKFVEKCKNKKG